MLVTTIIEDSMARRKSDKDKKLEDDEKLLRMWKKFHAELLAEACAGPHADVMNELMAQLKQLSSARALVDFITAQDWSAIDGSVRAVALHQINVAITKLRERTNPKEPISDSLDDECPNAFQLIRAIVNQFPAPVGAAPGNGI
jgi:hypothetical protein